MSQVTCHERKLVTFPVRLTDMGDRLGKEKLKRVTGRGELIAQENFRGVECRKLIKS